MDKLRLGQVLSHESLRDHFWVLFFFRFYVNNLADGLSSNAKLQMIYLSFQDVDTSANELILLLQMNYEFFVWKMRLQPATSKQTQDMFQQKNKKISQNETLAYLPKISKFLRIYFPPKTKLLKLVTDISSNLHKGKISKMNFNLKLTFFKNIEKKYTDFQCM